MEGRRAATDRTAEDHVASVEHKPAAVYRRQKLNPDHDIFWVDTDDLDAVSESRTPRPQPATHFSADLVPSFLGERRAQASWSARTSLAPAL